jgi:hypothetical protein
MVDIFQFDHETAESIAKANSEQGIFAQPTFRMVIDLKGFQHKGQRNNVDPFAEVVIEFALNCGLFSSPRLRGKLFLTQLMLFLSFGDLMPKQEQKLTCSR